MLRRLVLISSVVALAACSQPKAEAPPAPAPTQAAQTLTSASVKALFEAQGQGAMATLYTSDENNPWTQVEDGIASGDQAWLDITPLIWTNIGGNADAGEGMTIVLARALPKNPTGVLKLVASGLTSAEGVCVLNDIEPEPATVTAYYAAAIPAVEAVTDPSLAAVKTECLASLRQYAPK